MSAIPKHFGKPWSPYRVFIKDAKLSDREVLGALGLGNYVKIESIEQRGRRRNDYIAIGRDSLWTHVADNFAYKHWHSKPFRDAVANLGGSQEAFTFSVGDIDVSFDLHYYCGGSLIRRFVWEAFYDSGGRLKDEFGPPLIGEDRIGLGKDPTDGLWEVASALGIEKDYTKIGLKLYAPASDKLTAASK